MRRTRLMGAAAAALVGAVALSGCGVTGTDIRPGVAAQVGEERISVNEVDDLVSDLCADPDSLHRNWAQAVGTQPILRSDLRSFAVGLLVMESATRQAAAENSVELSAPDDTALEAQFAPLPDGQREAVVRLTSASNFISSALVDIGWGERGDGGITSDEAETKGLEIVQQWVADAGVELNPIYGIVVTDDENVLTYADTSTSVAVSDEATKASSEQGVEGRPASQVC